MATKQYKLTITDEIAAALRTEDGRGRLSEALDKLVSRTLLAEYRKTQRAAEPEPAKEGAVEQRHRLAAEKEAIRMRGVTRQNMLHAMETTGSFRLPYPEDAHLKPADYITPEEADAAYLVYMKKLVDDELRTAEADRLVEEHNAAVAAGNIPTIIPVKQSLRLSTAALRGLGLLGTPADMPDEVIQAENEHYALSPQAQALVFALDSNDEEVTEQ